MILLIFLLLFTSTAHAETVRVFTDYSPIRIMHIIDGTDPDLEAEKAGLSGKFKDMDSSEIPQDKTDRDSWKVKSGEIKVDSALKAENDKSKNEKTNALEKLKTSSGLTDSELAALGLGA